MAEPKKSKLEKLYEEAQKDFNLSVLNLSDKTFESPMVKTRWCFKLASEEKLLKKMNDTLDEMVAMYVEAHRGQRGGEYKAEHDANKQEDILKLRKQIEIQKDCIRFIQLVVDKNVSQFTWDVKNALQSRQLESM